MKIYILTSEGGRKSLINDPIDALTKKRIESDEEKLDGIILNATVSYEFGSSDLGDYNKGVLPFFSPSAYDSLFSRIAEDIKSPVLCKWSDTNGENGFVYGVRVKDVDCLDYEKSEYKEIGTDLILISKYVFIESLVGHHIVFKIPKCPWIFVTQEFVDLVKDYRLSGFKFNERYDSGKYANIKAIEQNNPEASNDKPDIVVVPDDEYTTEIEENIAFGKRILNIQSHVDDYSVISLIEEFLNDAKRIKESARIYNSDATGIAIGLGVLWSDVVCKHYGWTWKCIGESYDDLIIVIVSPKEQYYIDSIVNFNDICINGKKNNTKLLFNMLENLERDNSTLYYQKLE